MARAQSNRSFFVALILCGAAGCQSIDRIFHDPSRVRINEPRRVVRLVHYAEDSPVRPIATSRAPTTQPASRPPTTRPTTRPRSPLPYTAPSLWAQRLPFLMTPLVFGAVAAPTSAKEASESSLTVLPPLTGRAGLSAPPPSFASVVVSRPGLQEGSPIGLNFASPVNNLFTPRFNPLSGPAGRCQELAGAGFFQGRRSTCEQHFRR